MEKIVKMVKQDTMRMDILSALRNGWNPSELLEFVTETILGWQAKNEEDNGQIVIDFKED